MNAIGFLSNTIGSFQNVSLQIWHINISRGSIYIYIYRNTRTYPTQLRNVKRRFNFVWFSTHASNQYLVGLLSSGFSTKHNARAPSMAKLLDEFNSIIVGAAVHLFMFSVKGFDDFDYHLLKPFQFCGCSIILCDFKIE